MLPCYASFCESSYRKLQIIMLLSITNSTRNQKMLIFGVGSSLVDGDFCFSCLYMLANLGNDSLCSTVESVYHYSPSNSSSHTPLKRTLNSTN